MDRIHIDTKKLAKQLKELELAGYSEVLNAIKLGAYTGSTFLFKIQKTYLEPSLSKKDMEKYLALAKEEKSICEDCTLIECIFTILYQDKPDMMSDLESELDFSTDDSKFINFVYSKCTADAVQFLLQQKVITL